MMLPILAALASGTLFAGQQLIMRRYTDTAASPLIIPAQFGLVFPFWLLLWAGTSTTGTLTFNLAPGTLVYPLLWGFVTISATTTLVWLFRKFSLTELAGYRKALITLGALLMDITLFHLSFPPAEIAAITLLLFGALLLSHSRSRLPSLQEAGILIIWCSIMTLQISLYKEGQQHQTGVLANAILMQTVSSAVCAGLWLAPALRQRRAQGQAILLPTLPLLGMLACNLAGTLLEGFAYAGLPLAVVMVLTILPATLFAAHDLVSGHLPRKPRTFAALGVLALGLLLLALR